MSGLEHASPAERATERSELDHSPPPAVALPWLRHHAVFAVFLVVGAVERVLGRSADGPVGAAHDLFAVATAALIYVLLLRWATWRWLAALATAPMLLDPSIRAGDQLDLRDAVLVFVVSAAVLALAWSARPRPVVTGGVLLGAAATVLVAGQLHDSGASGWTSYDAGLSALDLVLLACLVIGLLGAFGLGRARLSRMRAVCLVTVFVPGAVLLVAGASDGWSWPHLLLSSALLPPAGALGLTALMRGSRGTAVHRPQQDAHDDEAVAAFRDRYGNPALGPVVVVIAAYNEAAGLPRVLETLPAQVCGLDADVVVVDDGSSDGTASAVDTCPGVFLAAPRVNRGQGAALRLGYRIAREHGARYIITTDADGQYDPADFPVVLGPILNGTADFVTGSRRRGRQETHDWFRRSGVYAFAWIASAMTGQWMTDTSFGLRAMRAEVTATVTLNQPQYQSSELLLGAHSHGFRITEVPGQMRVRSAGSTKKGSNLVYGSRYARVVFGTWWREGCPTPASSQAPALVGRHRRARAVADQ